MTVLKQKHSNYIFHKWCSIFTKVGVEGVVEVCSFIEEAKPAIWDLLTQCGMQHTCFRTDCQFPEWFVLKDLKTCWLLTLWYKRPKSKCIKLRILKWCLISRKVDIKSIICKIQSTFVDYNCKSTFIKYVYWIKCFAIRHWHCNFKSYIRY